MPHAPVAVLDVQDGQAELPFEGPVVVKLLHADVPHKTDVGGVVLGVQDAQGLQQAVARIRASLAMKLPDIVLQKVLVQQQTMLLQKLLLRLILGQEMQLLLSVGRATCSSLHLTMLESSISRSLNQAELSQVIT